MASKIYFLEDDDTIEICMDNYFKAGFTKVPQPPKIELSKLISVLIAREAIRENILANDVSVNIHHAAPALHLRH